MKNSEWGAVVYLTHSSYGRNGTQVEVNKSYYTGGTSGATATTNVLQSSTENSTGIYDLSGGAREYVASYITNGNVYLKQNGYNFAYTGYGNEAYKKASTKYATGYSYDSVSSDRNTNNWIRYNTLAKESNGTYGYGDAILETSTAGSGSTSWNSDYSKFVYSSYPVFIRGRLLLQWHACR